MPEVANEGLLRVAFVYGDAAAAAHLRDALAGQVEIAYAATAAEFDAQRAVGAGVNVALVNLDGADWVESLEAALASAGLRSVFNDPEISAHLDGWDRARWLRHLVAKLRGASDVDPPRPGMVAAAPAVTGQPLSTEEIDSLTANFAATPVRAADTVTDTLDVDTEALSALIDARLAEPESHGVADAAGSQHHVDAAPMVDVDAPTSIASPQPAVDPAVAVAEDPELPSLGEWELLDAEHAVPVPPSSRPAAPEPPLPDSLANITLVPLEAAAPLTFNTEPVELWMDDAKVGTKTRPEAGGGKQ